MKLLILTILVVCFSCAELKPKNSNADKWEQYKAKHGKKINKQNELKRMEKFFEKLEKIESHNQEYAQGKSKYYSHFITDFSNQQKFSK